MTSLWSVRLARDQAEMAPTGLLGRRARELVRPSTELPYLKPLKGPGRRATSADEHTTHHAFTANASCSTTSLPLTAVCTRCFTAHNRRVTTSPPPRAAAITGKCGAGSHRRRSPLRAYRCIAPSTGEALVTAVAEISVSDAAPTSAASLPEVCVPPGPTAPPSLICGHGLILNFSNRYEVCLLPTTAYPS